MKLYKIYLSSAAIIGSIYGPPRNGSQWSLLGKKDCPYLPYREKTYICHTPNCSCRIDFFTKYDTYFVCGALEKYESPSQVFLLRRVCGAINGLINGVCLPILLMRSPWGK